MASSEVPSVVQFSANVAEQAPPQPLPRGEYPFVVKEAIIHTSKQDDSKQSIRLALFIDPARYPPDFKDGDPDGTTLYVYYGIQDNAKARFRLRQVCEALGVPASNQINVNDFTMAQGIATVVHEDFQGLPQAKVAGIRRR